MNIAIPVWQGKVSSVFDFCGRLLLVHVENGMEISREEIALAEESGSERASRLRQLEAHVLICGAISRPLARMLTGSGIKVLPYVTGSVDQVIAAYGTGTLSQPQYALPGYWEGARREFHRRRN